MCIFYVKMRKRMVMCKLDGDCTEDDDEDYVARGASLEQEENKKSLKLYKQ